jgi:Na+:H+ antiporter
MEHVIEHAVGIYIGLLLLACLVGILVKRLAHLPYTIALILVGLGISFLHLGPKIAETGFSRELIFFVLLPPLLFQGALHLNLNRLLQHIWPILIFAILGVILSTMIIGGVCYWTGVFSSLMIAMLFGAMLSPTDPVSVLAIFKTMKVPKDLRYLMEGESLFNDGTGIVIFSIILSIIVGHTGFSPGEAVFEFFKVSLGGLLIGAVCGTIAFLTMRKLEDHLLENAICLVLAYGSFWAAEFIHTSGVMATVMAGLLIGNYGRRMSMSEKTIDTVETFFESIDFLINSFLFILIGIELQTIPFSGFSANLWPIAAAIFAMLLARGIVVYSLYWTTNLVGTVRPAAWAHVLFWGGLRGSIPIALMLGLPKSPEINAARSTILIVGFCLVFFSLVIQGITMKPLLRFLKVREEE